MNDLDILKDLKIYLEMSNVYIAYASIKNQESKKYMFLVRPIIRDAIYGKSSDFFNLVCAYQEIITGDIIIENGSGYYEKFEDAKLSDNNYFNWSVFINNPVNTILSIEEIKEYLAKEPYEIERTLRHLRNPQNDLIEDKSNIPLLTNK